MRRPRTTTPDDDPLMHRLRRATAEARRLRASPAAATSKDAALVAVAELAVVLRALVAERDRLGAQLETLDRQSRAVTAYQVTSGLRTLPPRAKRS